MVASRPADEDRLPWLEPYRDAIAQTQRGARSSHGRLVAIVTVLLLLPMAVAGGFWLGQRSDPPAESRPSATVALPPAKPAPAKVAEVPPVKSEPVVEAAAPATTKATKPARKKLARKRPRQKKIRTAGVETDRISAVRTAQREPTPPRPAPRPTWPKMPSPGPAGQVIQLGAFTTPTRASNAYYARIARYKGLAGMPRVIVPVVTKPDRRVLYVLRLGTTSRQQSKTICRNLRQSGDHCLVIG